MFYRLLTVAHRGAIFTVFNSFTDVSNNLWYNKAVSSIYDYDIVKYECP